MKLLCVILNYRTADMTLWALDAARKALRVVLRGLRPLQARCRSPYPRRGRWFEMAAPQNAEGQPIWAALRQWSG